MSRLIIPAAARPLPLEERWTVADEAFDEFLRRPVTPARARRMQREKQYRGTPYDVQRTKERVYDMETNRLLRAMRAAEGRKAS